MAFAPRGTAHLKRLADALADLAVPLPESVRELGGMYLEQIEVLEVRIAELDERMKTAVQQTEVTRRAQTMPGVGPITALALETFAPEMGSFHRGRDFAAWLGLVPRQHSTGGKTRLGKTSKMGQRDIRRLLISGAMAVLQGAMRQDPAKAGWLARLLIRKPRMVAAVALANKMGRGLWAMLTRHEDYRTPVATMA
jgi:transposase